MKILIIRVGRTGDIVMITAALKAIVNKWPEAELHVLTSPDGSRVLKGFHTRLTKFIIYRRVGLNGFLEKYRVKKQLNNECYDKIFCFELNKSFSKLVEHQAGQLTQLGEEESVVNYSLRCLKLVTDSVKDNDYWLSLPVTETGIKMMHEQLKEHGITDDDFVIGLHPSFSGFRKLSIRNQNARSQRGWPAEYFAKLAILLEKYAVSIGKNIYIIMDLVPEDRELGEKIVRLSGGNVKLFIPPLNFERYKALLQRLNLLVSPNTGPMHIAAAVGTPLVALFAGHDPRDCGPYVPDSQFRVLRAEDMPGPENGLSAITPEIVFEACKEFLP